jgi:hypothetical protein
MVLGSSEAIREPYTLFASITGVVKPTRPFSDQSSNYPPKIIPPKSSIFKEWLAGLIDGDGSFQLSKKGYGSLEITMDLKDEHTLQIIKNKYGGSIKLRSGANAVRYRLHNKVGLLKLINDVNGLIRHSNRIIQLNKICVQYGVPFSLPKPLNSFYNGWLSGFFDADGTVTMNSTNNQLAISISQKDKYLLDDIVLLYGGYIYIDRSEHLSYKWYITRKETIESILNYFKICPSRSSKKKRLALIPKIYELKDIRAASAPSTSRTAKAWAKVVAKFASV